MFTTTIQIEKNKIDKMNSILGQENFHVDFGRDDVIETFTAKFDETGFEVDIKICNGDGPYVDAILFKNDHEVCVLDATYKIQEEYIFEFEGETYSVRIEVV